MAAVCSIDPELLKVVKAFRFRREKTQAALLLKVNLEKMEIYLAESFEDNISVDELRNKLPEDSPVYVVYSYVFKHADGNVTYPTVFIYVSTKAGSDGLQMHYAQLSGSTVRALHMSKVFDIGSKAEFTEEWLKEQLSSFVD